MTIKNKPVCETKYNVRIIFSYLSSVKKQKKNTPVPEELSP